MDNTETYCLKQEDFNDPWLNYRKFLRTSECVQIDLLDSELNDSCTFQHVDLKCPEGHQIQFWCEDRNCKAQHALTCGQRCCSFHQRYHGQCWSHTNFYKITRALRQLANSQKNFTMKLIKRSEQMIREIREKRYGIIQKYRYGYLDNKFIDLIQKLYIKKQRINVSPSQGCQLKQNLLAAHEYMKKLPSLEENLLRQYDRETSQLAIKMNNAMVQVFEQFKPKGGLKNQDEEKERVVVYQEQLSDDSKPQIQRPIPEFYSQSPQYESTMREKASKRKSRAQILKSLQHSKIIDKDNTGNIDFIYNCLNKKNNQTPELSLIFRASDHLYKASEFHQACDNFFGTITLIKSQFGSIFGGYTPLKWNQAKVGTDWAKESFIFSIDMKIKLPISDPKSAISYDKKYGPIFGKQEIFISDECNNNRNSFISHPLSYKNDISTFSAYLNFFFGRADGNKFRVVDYEVYTVEW